MTGPPESPFFLRNLAALACGGLALVLRLLYLADASHTALFHAPVMDAAVHDLWARGLWTELAEGPYFRAPLYIWFLQAVYAVNDGPWFVRVLQALLSAGTVGLVADLARRLSGNLAAWIAGLFLAGCWPVIYFTGELVIVTFFVALLTGALWCLVRAVQEQSEPWAWRGAALLGVAALARPTALVFLPVLGALAWWLPGAARRRAGLLLGLALLPALAVTVRNGVVGGDWVFVASQGGVNFYIGNNRHSDGSTAVAPGTRASWLGGYEDTIRLAEEWEGRPLKPSEVSRYYFRKGLSYLRDEPADAIRLYAFKMRHLAIGIELSNNQNIHYWRAQSPLLRLPVWTAWPSIAALALVGIVAMCRRREAWPLLGFLLFYAAGLMLFFLNERFRTPLTVVLCVFTGVGGAALMDAVRAKRWRRVAWMAGLALLFFVPTRWDRAGFPGAKTELDVPSRVLDGDAWVRRGHPRAAIARYRDAARVAGRSGRIEARALDREMRLRVAALLAHIGDRDGLRSEMRGLAQYAQDPRVTKLNARLRRLESGGAASADSSQCERALADLGISVDAIGRPPSFVEGSR